MKEEFLEQGKPKKYYPVISNKQFLLYFFIQSSLADPLPILKSHCYLLISLEFLMLKTAACTLVVLFMLLRNWELLRNDDSMYISQHHQVYKPRLRNPAAMVTMALKISEKRVLKCTVAQWRYFGTILSARTIFFYVYMQAPKVLIFQLKINKLLGGFLNNLDIVFGKPFNVVI